MNYSGCTTKTKDRIIVVEERKSKFTAYNDNKIEVKKIEVDGCLFNDNEEKCDWIISIDSTKRALFIELKGCDLEKAISQLESTLQKTKSKYKNFEKECYAVTSRCPRHTPSIQRKIKKFNKNHSTILKIKNFRFEVHL